MGFMEPEIVHGDFYKVDTDCGTWFVPDWVAGKVRKLKDLQDYVEGTPQYFELQTNRWGARLSAPGYLDCTDWGVYDSEEEAMEALKEMYDLTLMRWMRTLLKSLDRS